MTEAKFIVEELNKLLDKNYNMLTIDSVSRIEMLQIIGNVLHKLDVLDDVRIFYYFVYIYMYFTKFLANYG